MVAPVGRDAAQRLLRVDRVAGELVWSDHGAVRYVQEPRPRKQGLGPPS